jgi:hypothetical protein
MQEERKQMRLKTAILGLVILVSGAARAQSCTSFLAEKFAVAQQVGYYELAATVTSLRAAPTSTDRSQASYTVAFLTYHPGHYIFQRQGFRWAPAAVQGDTNYTNNGNQLFNDRTTGSPSYQPFNVAAADRTIFYLDVNGNASLILESAGNTRVNLINLQCANGVMYGFSDEATPALYSITLDELQIPG